MRATSAADTNVVNYLNQVRRDVALTGSLVLTTASGVNTLSVNYSYYDRTGAYKTGTFKLTNTSGITTTVTSVADTYSFGIDDIVTNPLPIVIRVSSTGGSPTYDIFARITNITTTNK